MVGAVTSTLGAVAIVWALISAPTYGWVSVQTLGGLVLGAVMLVAMAVTERRVAEPMLAPVLLRSRRRVGALAVMALVVAAQFSMFFLLVQYLQRVLGFGPLASGFAFLPFALGVFAMSRVTPRLVGRFGAQPLLVVGTLGLMTSFVWLSQLSVDGTYLAGLLGPMLINGFSAGLVFMPVSTIVLGGVPAQHAGSASGLLQTTSSSAEPSGSR